MDINIISLWCDTRTHARTRAQRERKREIVLNRKLYLLNSDNII